MDPSSSRLPDNLARSMVTYPGPAVYPAHDGGRPVVDYPGMRFMPAAGSVAAYHDRLAGVAMGQDRRDMPAFAAAGTVLPQPTMDPSQSYRVSAGPTQDQLPSCVANGLFLGSDRGRDAPKQTQSLPRLWEVVGPKENLMMRPQEPVRQASPPKLRLPLSQAPASRSNQAMAMAMAMKRKSDDFTKAAAALNLGALLGPFDASQAAAQQGYSDSVHDSTPGREQPVPKRARQSGGGVPRSSTDGSPKEPRDSAEVTALLDVSIVDLPGEETKSVPVYDTCDMVRKKINSFLSAHPCITQAAFLRALARTWRDGRRLQGAQLNRFLALSGPRAGNTSGVFYAAYVFFEKMRIRDGKPKNKDRLEMERIYPDGMNTTDLQNYVTVMRGETVTEDRFGQLHFERRDR